MEGTVRLTQKLQFAFITLVLASQLSTAQTNSDSQQAARKAAWQDYSARLLTYKQSAQKAFTDEQYRAKGIGCPKEQTTLDISICLKKEVKKTTANYRAYSDGLRSIEGLAAPSESSSTDSSMYSTPQELVKQFDDAETAWQVYKRAQCSSAYGAYKGGTIAPIMQLTCELTLFRDRMRELESIYGVTEGKE